MTKLKQLFPQSLRNFYHLLQAVVANFYFGFPGRKLKVIGITGTDGKTTTCFYIHSILTAAGKKAGLVTSIQAKIGDQEVDTGFHVTNPDSWALQRFLVEMVREGAEYAVLEVTSHGIDQNRIWGIPFAAAGLTNITHEHLDYHGTFENYERVKLSFLARAEHSFRTDEVDDVIIKDVQVNLPGDYNRGNARLAAAVCQSVGIDSAAIKQGIESLTQLPGRMEVVYNGDVKVIVDFAHTPNAIEQALRSIRKDLVAPPGNLGFMVSHSALSSWPKGLSNPGFPAAAGRVIAVFGSASERDVLKRPVMGEVASRLADFVVITAEDPRFEDVNKICHEIAQGCEKLGKLKNQDYFIEPDRQKAIELATKKLAQPGDVVIIMGKGHEKSMNYRGVEYPWSDQEAVRSVLQ